MIWYKKLYVGKRAELCRLSLIRRLQENQAPALCYCITPASNPSNLLDIYPAESVVGEKATRLWPDSETGPLILGIALGYRDACELAASMVAEVYRATGGFDISEYCKISE